MANEDKETAEEPPKMEEPKEPEVVELTEKEEIERIEKEFHSFDDEVPDEEIDIEW